MTVLGSILGPFWTHFGGLFGVFFEGILGGFECDIWFPTPRKTPENPENRDLGKCGKIGVPRCKSVPTNVNSVPNGRVIKYPTKCALFGVPEPPGTLSGCRQFWGSILGPFCVHFSVHFEAFFGVILGPFWTPKRSPGITRQGSDIWRT